MTSVEEEVVEGVPVRRRRRNRLVEQRRAERQAREEQGGEKKYRTSIFGHATEFVNPGAAIEQDTEPAPAPSEAESAPAASEAAMRHTTTAVEC